MRLQAVRRGSDEAKRRAAHPTSHELMEKRPILSVCVCNFSRTCVVATDSDLTRAAQSSFSSTVNHFAVSGRSVIRK
jgi:hypothetical protein